VRRIVRAVVTAVLVVAGVVLLVAPNREAAAHAPHDNIADVALSPSFTSDSTVLAISRGHLLRSSDLGVTWTEVTNGLDRRGPYRLAISPSDRNRVYALVTGRGLYRSDDQGRSFVPMAKPGNLAAIGDVAVSPASADLLFAAPSASGLYRSLDGGRTWGPVGSFGRVRVLAVPRASHVVVADDVGGVHVSRDDGATWTAAQGLTAGDPITALASDPATGSAVFAGTQSGLVYRSTDGGSSFVPVGSGVPAGAVTSIAVSPSYATDRTVWLSSWHIGVFRSADGGATFVKRSTNLLPDPQAEENGAPDFGRVVVGRTASGKTALFVAGFHGLYRSTSGADSWREVETLTDQITAFAVSPDYANDGTVLAGTYVKGVFASRDRGASWATADVGLGYLPGTDFAPLQRVHCLVYSPDVARDGTVFLSSTAGVFVSTDRGRSWSESSLGVSLGQPRFTIAVSPAYASDRTVFLGSSSGDVWRSQAGGLPGSWQLLASTGSKVRSIVFSPGFATDRTMFLADVGGVRVSRDGGVTWTSTGPTSISVLAISPNHQVDGTLFAGTERGLFVTRDRGGSWTELTAPPLSTDSLVEAVAVSPDYPVDGTVLVSVRGSGLFRSTDGGSSFVSVGSSLVAGNVQVQDFNAPTSAPLVFSPAYATDRTIFGFGATEVVRSTDGGSTWSVLRLPPASTLLQAPVIAAAPTLTQVVEGAPGARGTMRIAFDLSHPTRTQVTVRWATLDVAGSPAIASSVTGDYIPAAGTLVFPPGSTRQYVDVVVAGDSSDEPDELVAVSTSGAANATIGGFYGLGLGQILDDDPGPVTPTVDPGTSPQAGDP
jgi:photosystem II stability/assembly factor-like uncharacterized protein